jgi:hypothetical protein
VETLAGAFAFKAVPTTTPAGYYTYESDGQLAAFGNDRYLNYLGDLSVFPLNKPIVGVAQTSDGGGYWLVASDGGIFGFSAPYYGSLPGESIGVTDVVGLSTLPGLSF